METPSMKLVSLLQSSPRVPLLLPPQEDRAKRLAVYEPESGISPDIESTGTLTLGFPASQILRNKFVLFMPSSSRYFCDSSQS